MHGEKEWVGDKKRTADASGLGRWQVELLPAPPTFPISKV